MVYLLSSTPLLGIMVWLFVRYEKLRKKYDSIVDTKRQLFARSHELERALYLNEDEKERQLKDLSSYLHDEVGSNLSSVKLLINSMSRSANGKICEVYERIEKHLEESIQQVRMISRNLYPPSLKENGLHFVVQELCEYATHPIITELKFHFQGTPRRFKSEHELVLFRAVQELLNNALKHSGGLRVEVSLNWQPGVLCIDIKDDGRGYAPVSRGLGRTGVLRTEYALEGIGAQLMSPPCKRGTYWRIKYPIQKS